jgi:hypothetical protein
VPTGRAGASEGGEARTSNEWGSVMSASASGASAEDNAERATPEKPRGRLDDGVAAHRIDAKPRTRGVGRGASPRATRAAAATRGRGSDATEKARAATRSVDIVPERVGARPARSTLQSTSKATRQGQNAGRREISSDGRNTARAGASSAFDVGGGHHLHSRISATHAPLTMAFFGLKCEPKKWTPFVPPPEEALRLHISQVRARAPADRRIRRQ